MAYFFQEPSHTFSEYLLVPGYSSEHCIPADVSSKTPVARFKEGEESSLDDERHPWFPLADAGLRSGCSDDGHCTVAKEAGVPSFCTVMGPRRIRISARPLVRKVKH